MVVASSTRYGSCRISMTVSLSLMQRGLTMAQAIALDLGSLVYRRPRPVVGLGLGLGFFVCPWVAHAATKNRTRIRHRFRINPPGLLKNSGRGCPDAILLYGNLRYVFNRTSELNAISERQNPNTPATWMFMAGYEFGETAGIWGTHNRTGNCPGTST